MLILSVNVLAINRPLPLYIVSKVLSAFYIVSKRVLYILYSVLYTLSVLFQVITATGTKRGKTAGYLQTPPPATKRID